MDSQQSEALFAGLRALVESAFPKHCNSCGRTFESPQAFLRETRQISQDRSGLRQGKDDRDTAIVEVYRNCACGSTLMDFFTDRRDHSSAGLNRRQKFEKLLNQLVTYGWSRDVARRELMKILRGKRSERIDQLGAALNSAEQ